MKKIILVGFSFIIICNVLGQNKPKCVEFGKQFLDTISLPSKHNYIVSVKLYPISKNDSKKYYNNPTSEYSLDFSKVKKIIVTNKNDNLNTVLIPPLKPNRFYILEIQYTGRYNIFGIIRDIHNSQDTKWLEEYDENQGEWLETVRDYNIQNEGKQLFFHPSITQLKNFKDEIDTFNLKTSIDTLKIKNILFEHFKILNFKKKEISDADILKFSRELKQIDSIDINTFLLFFKHLAIIPDYLNLYNFYEKKLKAIMDNNSFITHSEFENVVVQALEQEKEQYIKSVREKNLPDESLSNYIGQIENAIVYSRLNTVTTYPEKFETGYKRALVPDFGYITYIPYNGSIKGGSPYVGVNISLSPVNKNIPLKLSQLSFSQRFSIHTGVTLNSLEKTGFRDDFFSNYSLMIGGGYKILTQSTRLNFGGVLFKKIDAVSGNSSIAILPYVGLSIDIEIRKWLEGIIPTFTKI